jgi:hypothetical protein
MGLDKIWKRCFGGARRRTSTSRLRLERCEAREVPAVASAPFYAIGTGPGTDATVRVYLNDGTFVTEFKPFTNSANPTDFFQGGTDVAVGDIDGDGTADVITGAGPGGGPHVKVFSGVDILAGSTNPTKIRDFFAYQPDFRGGVNVAAGDVNGDGQIDIITGAGPGGGPHVVVYSNGNQNVQLMNFFPYETTFRGGVDVAAGDIGGDQVTDEVITGAGPGGGPKVGVYNYLPNADPTLTAQKIAEFFAYSTTFAGGVNVSSGYTTNNRDASNFLYADIITGAGPGGGPHVKVFRLLDALYDNNGNPANWQFFEAGNLFPYAASFTGGVRVGRLRNGSLDDLLTGPFQNGGPDFKIFNQTSLNDLTTYVPTLRRNQFPFPATFLGGIYVS